MATVTRNKIFVGGSWTDAAEGGTMEVLNPATGETIAEVPACTAADVDAAVEAAGKALPEWLDSTPAERAELLLKLADVLDENAEELAEIESRNVGKPLVLRARRDARLLRQPALLRGRRPDPRGPRRRRVHEGLHVDDPTRAARESSAGSRPGTTR